MEVPAQVTQWLAQTYPKPRIDPEWLTPCYEYVIETYGLNPARDLNRILQEIDTQLLASSLGDSMLHYTGIPRNIGAAKKGTVGVPPVLVQITSITEVGHSAFTLKNTRQTRIDRADLAGLAEEDGGEDDGPIPRYPRSMLKFRISDGSTEIEAIEYRKIPELELGVTPLGYKLLLKGVKIRRGIAFLEPSNVILKGHREEELDKNRERVFLEDLHMRLHPDEPFVEPADLGAETQLYGLNGGHAPAPEPAAVQAPPPVVQPPIRPAPQAPTAPSRANPRPNPPSTTIRPPATTSANAGPSRLPDTQATLVNSPHFASNKPIPDSQYTRESTVVDGDAAEGHDTEMEDAHPPPAPSGSDYFFDDPDEEMLAWADELEAVALSQQQKPASQQQQPASQGGSQPSSQTMPGSQGRPVVRTVTELFSSQGSRADEDGRKSPPKKRLKVSTARKPKPNSQGPPVRTITQIFGSQPARAPAPAVVQDDSVEEIQPKLEPSSSQAQAPKKQRLGQPQSQAAGPSTRTQEPARTQRRTETPPASQAIKAELTQSTAASQVTATQTGRASSAVTTTQVHDVIEIDDTDTEDESSAPPSSQFPPSSQWERYRRVAPGVGSFLDLT
ncbi:unnamed protein product [Peniophora sp. CBMAI 1063]|nr:unnamed protein product [Peniophora sp. CBMAI 1063]